MKNLYLLFAASIIRAVSLAQIPVYDTGIINENAVSALFTSEGTLNFNSSGCPAYYVPKDSMTTTIFCGALWVGGFDAGGQLHIAAQTYHQNGTDFWPGPMMDSLSYSTHEDTIWNHVWIIYKSTIDSFREGRFGSSIPASILNWPGNGDTSLGEIASLAPYVDSSESGYYNPRAGDYPLIRGDAALYTIFNDDRGAAHTETGGKKLGIEVHLMAYQYNSSDTTINETTFLHYDIYNRSKNNYDSVYFGSWIDMDVGYGADNLVGCDSADNYWYTYCGHYPQENGSGSFGCEKGFLYYTPAQSLAYLCDTMTHFMYYNNDFTEQGNPTTPLWYYFYMENVWGDSIHATYGGTGFGGTSQSNYMYSGNPADSNEWSEFSDGDVPGDRRGMSSTGPYGFGSGERKSLDLAFVFSRGDSGNGNIYPVTQLGARINDVKSFYNAQAYNCDETLLSVPTVKSNNNVNSIFVYPNPANGFFTITLNHPGLISGMVLIEVYNVLGENIYSKINNQIQNDFEINISGQPSGVYFYRVLTQNGNLVGDGKIIKQ